LNYTPTTLGVQSWREIISGIRELWKPYPDSWLKTSTPVAQLRRHWTPPKTRSDILISDRKLSTYLCTNLFSSTARQNVQWCTWRSVRINILFRYRNQESLNLLEWANEIDRTKSSVKSRSNKAELKILYNDAQSVESQPIFRKNISPPSSG
jgi:hypothetical protein